jgi:quercetin dioxygenase-like cupin family protein
MAKVLDFKKIATFNDERIFREMLYESPEMRIALMCLEEGQNLLPHKAPLRLVMYCVEGKGTFTVGDEEIIADQGTAIVCEPMVEHGFSANLGSRLTVMAVVTAVDME